MLERENFSKFLAHKLRHCNFFLKIGHWDIKTFFSFSKGGITLGVCC